MADKLLFLSHIHEEKELATLLKGALEIEFSGFVDVFVSSDGMSIPAGANFLKRIEKGLVECVGSIYLISPLSVKRNWINFELGAVWIRNIMSIRANGAEIPTLPVCHSGMTPSALPSPLNNLNGIVASQPSQLEFAFRSLQTAVGGKGALKTDFDALAQGVAALEVGYTLGNNLRSMCNLLNVAKSDIENLVNECKKNSGKLMTLDCGFQETGVIQSIRRLEAQELKDIIIVATQNGGVRFTQAGAINGADLRVNVQADAVLKVYEQLLT